MEAPDPSKAPSSSASTINELLDWRVRDRIRTLAAGLVLCLHLGVDPPDVVRPSPCARWESWIDPVSGREVQTIGIPESSETDPSNLEGKQAISTLYCIVFNNIINHLHLHLFNTY